MYRIVTTKEPKIIIILQKKLMLNSNCLITTFVILINGK